MAEPQPILVTATHELRQRSTTVPPGTPGEIMAMTGASPTYYTVPTSCTGRRPAASSSPASSLIRPWSMRTSRSRSLPKPMSFCGERIAPVADPVR
jgi:hypothetical protein